MTSEEVASEIQQHIIAQSMRENGEHVLCPKNKYGYQININHPLISPLFTRFKCKENLSCRWPISDAARFKFEGYILALIEKYEGDYEAALSAQINRKVESAH